LKREAEPISPVQFNAKPRLEQRQRIATLEGGSIAVRRSRRRLCWKKAVPTDSVLEIRQFCIR
jgi:hypothetical protein